MAAPDATDAGSRCGDRNSVFSAAPMLTSMSDIGGTDVRSMSGIGGTRCGIGGTDVRLVPPLPHTSETARPV